MAEGKIIRRQFGIIGRLKTEHFIFAGLFFIGNDDLQIIILGYLDRLFGILEIKS